VASRELREILMQVRNQIVGAWLVPVAMTFFGLSLISLCHFIPPLPPTLTAEQVAAHFREHSFGIRLGMVLFMFSGTLLVPITAIFALLIKRIEGKASILTYSQLITGTVALVLFIPPVICWTAAAYRPERAIEDIMLLNDLGWFFFIMIVPPGILQVVLIGIAILQDKRPEPLFPRWLAYLNFWVGVLFIPGGVVSLFKTGPFAWNGLIAFWIPVAIFGAWWYVMFIMCLKAIRKPA
jgi:hypothetical protein